MIGYVYFVTARDVGRVKIGHSFEPFQRISQLRSASPIPLCLERVCEGGKGREAELHQMFADHRLHGEWFLLSEEVVSFMETIDLPVRKRGGLRCDGLGAPQIVKDIEAAALKARLQMTDVIKQAGVSPTAFYRARRGDGFMKPATAAKIIAAIEALTLAKLADAVNAA